MKVDVCKSCNGFEFVEIELPAVINGDLTDGNIAWIKSSLSREIVELLAKREPEVMMIIGDLFARAAERLLNEERKRAT